MKQVIAVMILFALVLIGVAWNACYVNGVASRIDRLLDDLPVLPNAESVAKANGIRQYWEQVLPTVGLSVSYTVVDRVSEQSVALAAYAEAEDPAGYRVSLALLHDAVGDMCRLEQFSIANLF